MANIEHSAISDPHLHEPKGASSALVGQSYIANGAGSGTWRHQTTGWGFYKDNSAAQTIGTTAVKLSIDGAGATTEEGYLPRAIRGSGSLWNTTSDKITPIAVGDQYDIRLDLPVSAKSGTPNVLIVQLDIGGGASPTNVIAECEVGVSKTPPYKLSVGFPIFTLSTFLTNGGQIFIRTDSGTVDIDKPSIVIARNHGEI